MDMKNSLVSRRTAPTAERRWTVTAMIERIKIWMIKKLGGYTEEEVDFYREIAHESQERFERWKNIAHNLAWENAQLRKRRKRKC